jgi:hypothetical protein
LNSLVLFYGGLAATQIGEVARPNLRTTTPILHVINVGPAVIKISATGISAGDKTFRARAIVPMNRIGTEYRK